MDFRVEHDTMGDVRVPAEKLWGAQTQRSFENFVIGNEKMPNEIIRALAQVKIAAAKSNAMLCPERMSKEKADMIVQSAEKILSGELNEHFPLSVWQTGSGTQTNMNVNEVIANDANRLSGKKILHPNDDVNMSQSSNDVFPTAMNIAAVTTIKNRLLPSLAGLIESLKCLESRYSDVYKCGRTHLQDATPITFSQEVSGWRASLEISRENIVSSILPLCKLAIGGTAVGTGLNSPAGFDVETAKEISALTGESFCAAENKFHALSSKGEFVYAHGALKALAADLMKIANDIRWLSGGPRCGLGELTLPANEPGSSIMPGKVNPTQCEAVTMVCVQVIANDTAVAVAASQGNFELNVFMPVCIYNFLQSVNLLADVCESFNKNCVSGITVNRDVMHRYMQNTLMTATALTPVIGYEKTAEITKKAHRENTTLKEACLSLGLLTEKEFDMYANPEKMV